MARVLARHAEKVMPRSAPRHAIPAKDVTADDVRALVKRGRTTALVARLGGPENISRLTLENPYSPTVYTVGEVSRLQNTRKDAEGLVVAVGGFAMTAEILNGAEPVFAPDFSSLKKIARALAG